MLTNGKTVKSRHRRVGDDGPNPRRIDPDRRSQTGEKRKMGAIN